MSSAKSFLLMLSADRMWGTAAFDKFHFEITYLSDPSQIITLLPCLSVSFKLDWCDSGMQKFQLKNCWCCCSCQCCYWRGTYYWQIGREAEVWSKYQRWIFCHFFLAEVWFRHGAQGLVKILKLKFGQYFEADAYLRFDNIWKYNWEQR